MIIGQNMVPLVSFLAALRILTEAQSCNNGIGKLMFERIPDYKLSGSSSGFGGTRRAEVITRKDLPIRVLAECIRRCAEDRTTTAHVPQCRSFDFMPGKRISPNLGNDATDVVMARNSVGAEYDDSTCYLYYDQASPDGTETLVKQDNVWHFNEVCITSSKVSTECANRLYVMERTPGFRFEGHADREVFSVNRTECESKCINEETFRCRSATFDRAAQVCRMSRETKAMHPPGYMADSNSDYMENLCHSGVDLCSATALILEAGKELDGAYERDFFTVRDFKDCSDKCIQSLTERGFMCKSFLYYDKAKICVLYPDDPVGDMEGPDMNKPLKHSGGDLYRLLCGTSDRVRGMGGGSVGGQFGNRGPWTGSSSGGGGSGGQQHMWPNSGGGGSVGSGTGVGSMSGGTGAVGPWSMGGGGMSGGSSGQWSGGGMMAAGGGSNQWSGVSGGGGANSWSAGGASGGAMQGAWSGGGGQAVSSWPSGQPAISWPNGNDAGGGAAASGVTGWPGGQSGGWTSGWNGGALWPDPGPAIVGGPWPAIPAIGWPPLPPPPPIGPHSAHVPHFPHIPPPYPPIPPSELCGKDGGGSVAAFKKLGYGNRLRSHYVVRVLRADTLVDCERACVEAREFVCVSFNFRAFYPDNCELSDQDSRLLQIGNPLYFEQHTEFDYYEREPAGVGPACLDVSQSCTLDGMEFTLKTPEGFYGRIYTYGFYDTCFYDGNGGNVNVLRISRANGFPRCGTQQYGDIMTNIVVVQFNDYVQTSRDKKYNLTCYFSGPGEAVVTSNYLDTRADGRYPTQIEHLPAQNVLTSSVLLKILYRGTPTTTIAVGDLLTFRLEARGNFHWEYFADIFATNVIAKDPYSGRQVHLIDARGCPVDLYVFPELHRTPDGALEAEFYAFKIPDSNLLVFQATVRTCRGPCEPVICSDKARPGTFPSWGRKKREASVDKGDGDDVEEPSADELDVDDGEEVVDDEGTAGNDTEVAEKVHELLKVYLSRADIPPEEAMPLADPGPTVCVTEAGYYGMISTVIVLMCLVIVVIIAAFIFIRKTKHMVKEATAFSFPPPSSNHFVSEFHAPKFADPSEPIYTDPSLFERPRSMRSLTVGNFSKLNINPE